MKRYPYTLCLLTLSACGQIPPSGAPQGAPEAAPLATPALPPPAAAGTEPAPSAPAVAPAAMASAPTAIADGPKLFLVNQTSEAVKLLKAADGSALAANSAIFSKLNDDGITLDERTTRGFPAMAFVLGMAGKYPDSVWLTVTEPRGRSGISEVFHSTKAGWALSGPAPRSGEYIGIGNWSEGRVLAARFVERDDGELQHSFQLLSGPKTTLPTFSKPPPEAKKDTESACAHIDTLVMPQEVAILPSGDIYNIGQRCNAEGIAIEHWAPGHKRAEVMDIPSTQGWNYVRLLSAENGSLSVMASDGEATHLASFDGKSWQSEKLTLVGAVEHVDRSPDGTLFVVTLERDTPGQVTRPHVWQRSQGQASFSELLLPPGLDGKPLTDEGLTELVASARDDVWVYVGGALLHTRPAPSGPRSISFEHGQQLPADLRVHKLASEHCKDVFVLFFPVGRSAPADYDFPELRRSLAGHAEFAQVSVIESEDNGVRYVGASVADLDQGKALAQLASKTSAGSKPALLCASPKRDRDIPVAWSLNDRR